MQTQGVAVPLAITAGEGADRIRLLCASLVVLLHAGVVVSNPAFARALPEARTADAVLMNLAGTFPVNGFLFLSFLLLGSKIRSGASWRNIMGRRLTRLAPAYLFWTALYAGLHVAAGARPSARALLGMVLLGQAAAHLYYVPLLLALTAAYPLFERLARFPRMALLAAPFLALAVSYAYLAIGPRSPYAAALLGLAGVSYCALVGLALARWWGGLGPPPERRGRVLTAAVAVAALAGAVVIRHAMSEAANGGPIPFDFARRVAGIGYSLAVPVIVLVVPLRLPSWGSAMVPLSFGIYLAHPLFLKVLQGFENRIPALHGATIALALPNGLLVLAATTLAVALLMRTPLRRIVS